MGEERGEGDALIQSFRGGIVVFTAWNLCENSLRHTGTTFDNSDLGSSDHRRPFSTT